MADERSGTENEGEHSERKMQLDVLISVQHQLARQADLRRQRADAAGATLMTTAVTLAAATVAGVNALENSDPVPESAVYVTFLALVATVLFGGMSRAGRVLKMTRSRKRVAELLELEQSSRSALRAMAQEGALEAGTEPELAAKEEALRLWSTTAEIGHLSVELKNRILGWGGMSLAVALAALGLIGLSVLAQVW